MYDPGEGECFPEADGLLEHKCVWQCRVRMTWEVACQKCCCKACTTCLLQARTPAREEQAAGCCRHDGLGCPTHKEVAYPRWAPGYSDDLGAQSSQSAWAQTHFGAVIDVPTWRPGMTLVVSFGNCIVSSCEAQQGAGAPVVLAAEPPIGATAASCTFVLRQSPRLSLRAAGKREDDAFEIAVVTQCLHGASVTPDITCPLEKLVMPPPPLPPSPKPPLTAALTNPAAKGAGVGAAAGGGGGEAGAGAGAGGGGAGAAGAAGGGVLGSIGSQLNIAQGAEYNPPFNIAPPIHRVVTTLALPTNSAQQLPSVLASYRQQSYTKLPPQYIRQTSSSCDSATIEWVPHDIVRTTRMHARTAAFE